MRRIVGILFLVAVAAVPAPASARTRSHTATVIGVGRHGVKVALPSKVARSFKTVRAVPAKVKPGTVVRFAAHGGSALSRFKVVGRARQARFYGRVVRVGKGRATLKLSDGSRFVVRTGSGQAARRAGRARLSAAARPGRTVLVTVNFSDSGDTSTSVDVVDGDGSGVDLSQDDTIDGTVTAVSSSGSQFTVVDENGVSHDFTLSAAGELTSEVEVCDIVHVSYRDVGGKSVADDVEVNDTSDADTCGDDGSADDSTPDDGALAATVLAIGPGTLTVRDGNGKVLTLPVDDPASIEGIAVGDSVQIFLFTDDSGQTSVDDVQED
jgi:hypothetical protein